MQLSIKNKNSEREYMKVRIKNGKFMCDLAKCNKIARFKASFSKGIIYLCSNHKRELSELIASNKIKDGKEIKFEEY